jgi:hypothetical protein
MNHATRRIVLVVAGLGSIVGVAARSEAAPITYTETVVGSGSLGGIPFADALVTLTQVADTNNVVDGLFHTVQNDTVNVNVVGIGTATTTAGTTTTLSASASGGFGGLYSIGGSTAILALSNSAFVTYDLRSSIGPLSGQAAVSGIFVPTNAGLFKISSVSSNATFQATGTTAVPEPSSLIMAGISILALSGVAWRRKRGAS